MSKLNRLKFIQFIVITTITFLSIMMICVNSAVFQNVMNDRELTVLCFFLWITFVVSFLFLLLDMYFLAQLKKEYYQLNKVAYSDPSSNIPDRNSCDAVINKHLGSPLPENFGCIVLELSSLQKINASFGYEEGDHVLRDFSLMLKSSALSLCFVGRNGGNRFLAVFESEPEERAETFLKRVRLRMDEYNEDVSHLPIEYRFGTAFNKEENFTSLHHLIALADQRVNNCDG